MSMDLTGITNQNEYYTNHYFSSIFEENAAETISKWRAEAKESDELRTPWSKLREASKQYYPIHDRFIRSRFDIQTLQNIQALADSYMDALGYPAAMPENIPVDDTLTVPVYHEINKANGAPFLWIMLAASREQDAGILESNVFDVVGIQSGEPTSAVPKEMLTSVPNEDLATKILFAMNEPPRFIIFIGMNQIALIDRNKWNEKRYLQFELEDIFSRREDSTLQAMAVLLHKESLCPNEGVSLIDELDSNSQKHAAGVSQDLKYALRESIELLGNEVLHDMKYRQGIDLISHPVDAGQLTIECLRYMYRMLFVLFIEARPELGYAPIKAQSYLTGYSLESLRDIADNVREDVDEVGDGYYLHETLAKLYDLIYNGYPSTEEEIQKYSAEESLHDMFVVAPLKAHIFDPEYTKLITTAKIRNRVMLRIVDLMSLSRASGKRNERRGRISYANLGINQLGAVYEALLSYRGFIAEEDLYEVKRAGDQFNELDVGYFVKENELEQYTEEERVRYESGENKGKLRMYKKGSFIYRLAGREREKSASYYTPEVLTKCLVKYALKELLEGKNADEILELTVCEPAMGSAAFLNETINQLAEAYVDRKQKELGETIPYDKRFTEIQKVKMFIADRNVYGIDLNPVAVELAEVSLWLNTIFEGGFVPWFNTQLVNGNSLIGARRQCYRIENAQTTTKGLRWYEMAPERLPFNAERADKGYKFGRKQIYHFLLGDPGMCAYSDKVIKSLEPDNIKKMVEWNKKFTAPISDDDVITLLRLSAIIDDLWKKQIELRKTIEAETQDKLSVFGHEDRGVDSHTSIRQKDAIYRKLYKSEQMKNAGPYARLKFAMDYWCALWFWPIEKADLLPSRSEFLFDMALILEGTTSMVKVSDTEAGGQLSMFPTEMQQLQMDLWEQYDDIGVVDIPALRQRNPRLNLAAEIAEQNKFMHWELEFADLFAEHGGFDLVIGNPPWVKIEWKEQDVIADRHPMFAVKGWSATETAARRDDALADIVTHELYLSEYEGMSGEQSFLNAAQNYYDLKGQQTNLYKCFLPQAWRFGKKGGISAFVHPDGVFDDPRGNQLRKVLYPKLRYHFNFRNELLLFSEVAHLMTFSLNIYKNENIPVSFDVMGNVFDATTIDESYSDLSLERTLGLKVGDKWNIRGQNTRITRITKKELSIFAKLFDEGADWQEARLPIIHSNDLIGVFEKLSLSDTVLSRQDNAFYSEMWHETNAQKDGTIYRNVSFPESEIGLIVSGPHIDVSNPFAKTARRRCVLKSDYDSIDLLAIDDNYHPRCVYSPKCSLYDYDARAPKTKDGERNFNYYRIVMRNMFSLPRERTLIPAIIPPKVGHVHAVFEIGFKDPISTVLLAGFMSSLPLDFYVKSSGKGSGGIGIVGGFPMIFGKYKSEILLRALLLNCITKQYKDLWQKCWDPRFIKDSWTKNDNRLPNSSFDKLTSEWTHNTPLRDDFSRRQALIELDVLVGLELGLSLKQLKLIYNIQFPVLQDYESDTWYDANGRIVFTKSKSLTNIGFTRPEWENGIKGAPAGQKFYRTIIDDTMPGGPVERTIEYVAPFDRCDREKDYETAWKFFEEKYGKKD